MRRGPIIQACGAQQTVHLADTGPARRASENRPANQPGLSCVISTHLSERNPYEGHDRDLSCRSHRQPCRLRCRKRRQLVRSAPAACRDFTSWYLGQHGSILAGKGASLLRAAAAEAPGGQLYRDMGGTLKSDVTAAAGMQGGSLGVGSKGLTIEAAYTVEQDCQSVNPSS